MESIELGLENIQLTNDKEYYTIPEIVEQAQSIFELKFPGNSTDKTKVEKKIKQVIRRALKGAQSFQPKGAKRKSMYSRAVVYSLLNSKCRHYFLNIKKELAEKEFQKWANSHDKEKKAEAETEAEAKLKEADKQLEMEEHTQQIGDEYRKAIRAVLDGQAQDDDNGEEPIFLRIEEAKVKIFFQYLFESLIDFDINKYVNDLQNAPDPSDINPSDIEATSARRLLDLHNYYKGRVNLAEVLNRLYQALSKDTKPQEKQ